VYFFRVAFVIFFAFPLLLQQLAKGYVLRGQGHKPAGIKLGLGPIGWHTFRHTYRSWLDETGAPMKVQQELMRHASIQTTMNVYGQAMPESKREANGRVVTMVLKPLKASA
jgi:integrase